MTDSFFVSLLLSALLQGDHAGTPIGVFVLGPEPASKAANAPIEVPVEEDTAQETTKQLYVRRLVSKSSDRNEAEVRYALLLPERPVLVAVSAWIDGQTLSSLREQLVEACWRQTSGLHKAGEQNSSFSNDTAASRPELLDRLRQYVRATERMPDRDEIRWLLARWSEGGVVLHLRDAFRGSPASESAVFDLLDANEDRTLSVLELQRAYERFRTKDLNRDDIFDLLEITKRANGVSTGWQIRRILLPVDGLAELKHELDGLYREVSQWPRLSETRGQADGNPSQARGPRVSERRGHMPADEWLNASPEVRIQVRFDSKQPANSKLEIVTADPAVRRQQMGKTGPIELEIAGAIVSVSAAQVAETDGVDEISIGAVADAYPLFHIMDSDGDGRITLRELGTLSSRFKLLDKNADGQIAAHEIPQILRFGVGLGPVIHRHLADRPRPAQESREGSPSWFIRMDRNGDGDISWGEFLGNKQQFDAMDTNGDRLINRSESLQSP